MAGVELAPAYNFYLPAPKTLWPTRFFPRHFLVSYWLNELLLYGGACTSSSWYNRKTSSVLQYFPCSKCYRRNPPMFVLWKSCATRFPITMLDIKKWHFTKISLLSLNAWMGLNQFCQLFFEYLSSIHLVWLFIFCLNDFLTTVKTVHFSNKYLF
jgi:hypothetical protein